MNQEIIVVLDRSGSMDSIASDMKGGLKQFVEEQKKVGEAGFTFAIFDDQYDLILEGAPISTVNPEFVAAALMPRGSTALNDAIGKTIISQGERFAKMPESDKPKMVIMLIVTDGQENHSQEWSGEAIKALIEKQQNEWKWGITILGCGIDAIGQAKGLHINLNNALNVGRNSKGIAAAYAAVSHNTSAARSTGDAGQLSYTNQQRGSSMGTLEPDPSKSDIYSTGGSSKY